MSTFTYNQDESVMNDRVIVQNEQKNVFSFVTLLCVI